MVFLSALYALVGCVSGIISIYKFINSLPHTPARRYSIFGLVLTYIFIAAFIISITASISGTNRTSTQNSGVSTPQHRTTPTVGITSTTAPTPTPTPTPTNTPIPTPSPTPTPTTVVAGGILYQADFINHPDEWPQSGSVHIAGGKLIITGGSASPNDINLPTPDYYVEAVVKIIEPNAGGFCSFLGIEGRYDGNNTSNEAGVSSCTNQYEYVSTCPRDACAVNGSIRGYPETGQQFTIRITSKGTSTTGIVNGTRIGPAENTSAFDAGTVAILVDRMSVEVLSFKVVAV